MFNFKTTINVLTDGETWMMDDCAYFKKLEMVEGSDAFVGLESGYIPDPDEEGVVGYIDIKISLDFVEKVYELAFGENAIQRYSEKDEKDVLDFLEYQLEAKEVAVDLSDKRSFDEYLEVMQ